MAEEPSAAYDVQARIEFEPDTPAPPLPVPVLAGIDKEGAALLVFPALLSASECARLIHACTPHERAHTYSRTRSVVSSVSLSSVLLARMHAVLAAAPQGSGEATAADSGAGGGGPATAALQGSGEAAAAASGAGEGGSATVAAAAAAAAASGEGGEAATAAAAYALLRSALTDYHRHGSTWVADAINPVWRFVSYQEGGYLSRHLDATTRCQVDCVGMFTAMGYLTAGYEGGELRLLQSVPTAPVDFLPDLGDVVLLDRRVLHEALAVRAGQGGALKQMIRSELFCVRAPPLADEQDRAAAALLAQAEAAEGREDKARLTEQALAMSTRLEECYYNF